MTIYQEVHVTMKEYLMIHILRPVSSIAIDSSGGLLVFVRRICEANVIVNLTINIILFSTDSCRFVIEIQGERCR